MFNVVLFSMLKSADRFQGRLFLEAVIQKDKERLRNLVRNEYPKVAWGGYLRRLTDIDQEWALATIARLN